MIKQKETYNTTALLNLGPQFPHLQNKEIKHDLPGPKSLIICYWNCEISIYLKISNVKARTAKVW